MRNLHHPGWLYCSAILMFGIALQTSGPVWFNSLPLAARRAATFSALPCTANTSS
jgi:hypothetical protein